MYHECSIPACARLNLMLHCINASNYLNHKAPAWVLYANMAHYLFPMLIDIRVVFPA